MAILSSEARVGGVGAVDVAQTRLQAGTLLEQGAAFAVCEGARLASAADGRDHGDPVNAGDAEHFDVIVIGAGQAGLSVGYHLARRGLRFVLLEAHDRVGEGWRRRWDSLRLFTPARYDGLDGMRFPGPQRAFPSKDEMADFLERYAAVFRLPVRTGVRVDEVTRQDGSYLVRAGQARYHADHVVVAAAGYQKPRIPDCAAALDPAIRQLHSSSYRRPSQLAPGPVLLVGAGNSGAELAIELARSHRVWLAGRHPGHLPVRHDGALAYHLIVPVVFRILFHRLLSVDTPIGRKARPHFLFHGGPLIRVKPADLARAGVERVPRVVGTSAGKPLLEGGQVLDVANVVWCTGFQPGLEWIRVPGFDAGGRPEQYRGAVAGEPGLYFAGLAFQHAASSSMIHGVGRDAECVAGQIALRLRASRGRAGSR